MSDDASFVSEAQSAEELSACLAIRRRVFVEEQGVPLEIEVDGEDGLCRHYLAYRAGAPVGAARMKPITDGVKLQRIAVLPAGRGEGHGVALVTRMIAAARASDSTASVVLASQTSAIGFYEKLGFVAEGEEFMDADIPHRTMRYAG